MTRWSRLACASLLRWAVVATSWCLAALVSAGIVGLGWWGTMRTSPPNSWPLTASILIVLGAGASGWTALRASRPRSLTDGAHLTPEAHPSLWASVRQVMVTLGVRPPDDIFLSLDPQQLCQFGRTARFGRRRRVLVLGVAAMCALSADQWRAALTQQLVVEESEPRGDRLLWRSQRRMSEADHYGTDMVGLRWVRSITVRAHTRLALSTCRSRQFRADAVSAEVAGSSDARLALLRVPAAHHAWEDFWSVHVVPGLALLRRPIDVVGGFRLFLSARGIPELAPAIHEVTSDPRSFVGIEERLTRPGLSTGSASSPSAEGVAASTATAIDLLGDPTALVELELAWFTATGLTPLDWDALAHATAAHGCVRAAAWFQEELSLTSAPWDLTAVLGDLRDNGGARVHQVISTQLADEEPDAERDLHEYAGTLIGNVVAAALVEGAAAHFVVDWSGRSRLVDADESVLDPWSAATVAMTHPDVAEDLRRWCLDRGASPQFVALAPGPSLGRTVTDSDPVVLCTALLYTSWLVRYVYILDTGLVVMRPRWSDLLVAGLATYGGDPGLAMLQRWSGTPASTLLMTHKATYVDWTDIRSAKLTTSSRGRVRFEIERVDGSRRTVKGGAASRYFGNMVEPLAHFLGDRFVHVQRQKFFAAA